MEYCHVLPAAFSNVKEEIITKIILLTPESIKSTLFSRVL